MEGTLIRRMFDSSQYLNRMGGRDMEQVFSTYIFKEKRRVKVDEGKLGSLVFSIWRPFFKNVQNLKMRSMSQPGSHAGRYMSLLRGTGAVGAVRGGIYEEMGFENEQSL